MTSIKGNNTGLSNQLPSESSLQGDSSGQATEQQQESFTDVLTKFILANTGIGIQAQAYLHYKQSGSSFKAFEKTASDVLPYNIISGPFGASTGCIEEWKGVDIDGDGYSVITGDCWDSEEGPEGSDLTGTDIHWYATETWYDGVDQDCHKDDDYDADGDGYVKDSDVGKSTIGVSSSGSLPGGDCSDDPAEDLNATGIFPGQTEKCNGYDDNCDGLTDGDDPALVDGYEFYRDKDGDGFGDVLDTIIDCEAPEGYVENYDDCDDNEFTVNPDETEVCDGLDNDCDSLTDEDDDSLDLTSRSTFYADADEDGFGDSTVSFEVCDQPTGTVLDNTDCDDSDANINPSATEVCNGYDDDCNTLIDEEDTGLDLTTRTTWVYDGDRDGYATTDTTTSVESCEAPSEYYADSSTTPSTDCDDANNEVYPGFPVEYCNGYDDDCDGLIDSNDTDNLDLASIPNYYQDADSDGYGNASVSVGDQCDQPTGYVLDGTDCDDTNASINPGETEICDVSDVDENCNGLADDGDSTVDTSTYTDFYTDSDGDGYGDSGAVVQACDQPSGSVVNATDCDDTDAAINPLATEVCDLVDNNCDSLVDDDDSSLDLSTATSFYDDNDGDGYGDITAVTQSCAQPTGTVTDNTDCNDAKATINPGATEICDVADVDENCNGVADDQDSTVDSSGYTTYYIDSDGDGYGSSTTVDACDLPLGAATGNGDCDDTNAAINPVAQEVCDESDVDEDCDGVSDDSDSSVLTSTQNTYYADFDADGFGDASVSLQACDPATGYVENTDDCDDTDDLVWSTKSESFNGYDDNCDGVTDYDVSYTTAQSIWVGEDGSAQAGYEVAGGGDLDNDGLNDFVVGAPGEDGTGAAYVVGYNSGTNSLATEIKISGTYSGAETGESLDYGDINNDGFVDLLIGSPDDSSNYGVVYLFDGPVTASASVSAASAAIIGSGNGAYAGEQVRSGCDLTADGVTDILIGEPAANKSYVINGPVSSSFSLGSTTAFAVYTGEASNDFTGYVRCLGDVNADGNDDFGVGGWGVDYGGTLSGSQYWFYGPLNGGVQSVGTADLRIDGESAGDNFGSSGGFGKGDVNNDGYDDVIVDAIGDDDAASAAGAVYLFYGNTSLSGTISSGAYDAKFLGEVANNNAGTRAGIVGDINSDFHDDIVITAYNYGSVSGAVYALYGTSSLSGSISLSHSTAQLTGDTSLDRFGRSAAQVGDVDGDGFDDIVTGASGFDQSSSDQGAAYLFMGF